MTEKGRRTWNFYFNSHPHEEDDNNPDGGNSVRRYFNSHPHEEDDGVPDWQAHK